MNKRLIKLFATTLVAAMLLYTTPMIMPAARATDLSSSPPSFWVEPDNETFTTATTPINTTFTVTVYGAVPTTGSPNPGAFDWFMELGYDTSQLQAVGASWTNASKTCSYLYAHYGINPPSDWGSVPPSPNNNVTLGLVVLTMYPGYISAGESLLADEYVPAGSYGPLFSVTFKIILSPPPGVTLTCDIDPHYGDVGQETYWDDTSGLYYFYPTLNEAACVYSYIGPAAPHLLPPVALFDYSPKPVVVGQPVTFDGSASYSPNGTITSWNWSFGDGGLASGKVVTYTYSSPGIFNVNLTVTDSNSLSNSTTKQVVVYATQPTKLYIDPPQIIDPSLLPPAMVTVNVTVNYITGMYDYAFNLTYDNSFLSCIGARINRVQNQTGFTSLILIDDGHGFIWVNVTYHPPSVPISTMTPLALVTVYFQLNTFGASILHLANTELSDPSGQSISHLTEDGFIMTVIRDVAVVGVSASASWAYAGWPVSVTVIAENLGNMNETFDVTAYYSNIAIGTIPVVDLPPDSNTTLTFAWNTNGLSEANYTLSARASMVPYEFNTTNNYLADGQVLILTAIRDVAIINVVASPSWAYSGAQISVNVTAANVGNVTETFSVTAYYNSTVIGTLPVANLAAGSVTVLTFNWDTTGLYEDNYTISAVASAVQYEYNALNNEFVDGQVGIVTTIRDVAIINVTAVSAWSSSWVYRGATVNVTVTAENSGQIAESFYVSAFYDTNLIGNVSVANLAPGAIVVEVFAWNTATATAKTNYTVSGQASIVPFEFNTSNNVFIGNTMTVRLTGDMNGDGKVDMKDIGLVAKAFGSYGPDYWYPGSPPSSRWNPDADITGPVYLVPDGKVDMRDVAIVAKNFGKS